ncbi:unnamed protein product [Prorocentrum cordatum]|uniref:glutathione transferase n=1 Tax=Prorocentrum cordatum TaxID=2364126 RepID=A0ABN9R1K9_9DINO|nr:unnamed protein product [Polarella glacialis]
MRDNYTLEYARLNPDTMAVPTLEIDDKVITESHEIVRYLFHNYPGPGDREVQASGRAAEMWAFVDLARSWDEYVFTYGHMGAQSSDMANGIRLLYLRYYLGQTLREKPEDEQVLVSAYVNKIAGIMTMNRVTGGGATPEAKEKEMQTNRARLDGVLAAASALLGSSSGFLFGDQLCTADACFLPILRTFLVATPAMFEVVFAKHPNLREYWERAQASEDVQQALLRCVRKGALAWFMLKKRVPKTILAYKMGLLRAPPLPDEIERPPGAEVDKTSDRQHNRNGSRRASFLDARRAGSPARVGRTGRPSRQL